MRRGHVGLSSELKVLKHTTNLARSAKDLGAAGDENFGISTLLDKSSRSLLSVVAIARRSPRVRPTGVKYLRIHVPVSPADTRWVSQGYASLRGYLKIPKWSSFTSSQDTSLVSQETRVSGDQTRPASRETKKVWRRVNRRMQEDERRVRRMFVLVVYS